MTEHGKQAWADSYTLLCERCGYVIEGLAEDSVCPECAKPVAESMPGRRPGTPWQQRRGLRPMLHTWWLVVRHPLRTLDTMTVARPRMRLLLLLAALPFGQLMGIAMILLLEVEHPIPNGSMSWTPGSAMGSLSLGAIIGLALTPLAALALWLLTWIEARGLVLFGAQAGTRMHPDLAHTIVRHGAVGWLLAGLGATLILPLAWSYESEMGLIYGHPKYGGPADWTIALATAGVFLAILGFLAFECFAWLGLRRCKFANRSRT
ncbi:MAG: hypothetical protein ACIAQU_09085 [Phycisphaerales bacterium JB064]